MHVIAATAALGLILLALGWMYLCVTD